MPGMVTIKYQKYAHKHDRHGTSSTTVYSEKLSAYPSKKQDTVRAILKRRRVLFTETLDPKTGDVTFNY